MNDPREERELERFLAGESPVSQQYRGLSGAEPPPELDARILAAAEAEVRRDDKVVVPLGRPWQRWATAVGVAASVMLAFTVVMQVAIGPFGEDAADKLPVSVRPMEEAERSAELKRESAAPPETDSPAKERAVAAPASVPARPSRLQNKAMVQEELAADAGLAGVASMDTPVPVPSAAPAPAGALSDFSAAAVPVEDGQRLAAAVAMIRSDREAAEAGRARSEIVVTARRRDTETLAVDAVDPDEPATPDAQLDELLRLYDAGDQAGAAEQLARFVDTWPEHPVTLRLDELD